VHGLEAMRVLFIIQCTNLGGMEHNMLMLIKELRALHIKMEVVSLNPLGEMGALLAKEGIPASGLPYAGKWGWRSLLSLRRFLKTKQADGMVMIGHNLMGSLAIGELWRPHRVLSIHYHHRGVKPNWQWRLIYAVAALQFRSVVFVSEYIMREAIPIAPFLRARSLMVSTPVQVQPIRSGASRRSARERLGIPTDAKVAGNAGWLIARKRWDVFLDVAATVVRTMPEATFLIAGDGPDRSQLEQKAATLGIARNLIWLGWQKSLADFHQAIDVLLFNSDWDAQARTPLEAMSSGIPLVASILQGGTREVILDDSMGVLRDTHDVETLAQHVVRLLGDADLASEVGLRGRRRIDEYGSPRQHAIHVLEALGLPAASNGSANKPA